MPKRSTNDPPPPREWTLAEVDRGISKLCRRIADVESLGSQDITHKDPQVAPVESEIIATIEDVFGTDSREHREYRYIRINYSGGRNRTPFNTPRYMIEKRDRAFFQEGVKETVQKLQGLIRRLEEVREDFRKCPKCSLTFRNLDYCIQDGTALVSLSFDADAATLRK